MEIKLLEQAKKVLEKNWQDGFTIPCEGLYPFQWNWDSGFIALGWAHIDMEKAKSELRYLLSGQWSNGFLPHIIFHNESETYFPGPEVHAADLSPYSSEIKTSGITQPPVLGFVLEELFIISGNTEFAHTTICRSVHSGRSSGESGSRHNITPPSLRRWLTRRSGARSGRCGQRSRHQILATASASSRSRCSRSG